LQRNIVDNKALNPIHFGSRMHCMFEPNKEQYSWQK
jgi:hypothetical protein